MADMPFFRGPNSMDWLFAVTLQTACDWKGDALVAEVANQFGFQSLTRYQVDLNLGPDVTLVWCEDYVFVCCNSTKTNTQWLGNVLGSSASEVAPANGTVSTYFGAIARAQWSGIRQALRDGLGSRQIVVIGFSLGGATATIIRDMLLRADNLPSAGVVFGCPRPGTTTFAAGYNADNFSRFTVVNDVVGSVPPVVWTSLGLRNDWTPFPPFVTYVQPGRGFTLSAPDVITPGDYVVGVDELILGFDTGLWLQFHNQSWYARLLRAGLPEPLEDGFDGYPLAGQLDSVCTKVFDFSPVGWPWAPFPTPSELKETIPMGCQIAIYFQDVGGKLGFQEILYTAGDDPSVGYGLVFSPDGPLLSARRKFLSNSLEIFAVRCSRVSGVRQSYSTKFIVPAAGQVNLVTEKIEPALTFFGYNTDRTQKRQFHFRGIPKSWATADSLTTAGQDGAVLATRYLDILIANGIQLFSKNNPTKWPIQSAAKPTQSDPIAITLQSNFTGLPAGSLVQLRGCKTAPLLNGWWLTAGVNTAPNILTLAATQNFSAPAQMTGYLRTYAPSYSALTGYEFNAVTKHATGVPSFRQRGRSSARIRRR